MGVAAHGRGNQIGLNVMCVFELKLVFAGRYFTEKLYVVR